MPSNASLLTAVAAATLLLSGCLATENERIMVQRDPGLVTRAERDTVVVQKIWPPEPISATLEASVREMRSDEHLVRAELATVSEDPWATYEDERADVLVRPWADAPWIRPPLPETASLGGDEQAGDEAGADEAPAEEDSWGDEKDAPEEDPWGDEDDWG